MFTEVFVFGNVRIEVLHRVFRNVFSHNDLIIPKDVSKRKSRKQAFVLGFYGVESHFCKSRKQRNIQVPEGILCGHSSCPHSLPVTGYKMMPALLCSVDSTDCHVIEEAHIGCEKCMPPLSGTIVTTNIQTH